MRHENEVSKDITIRDIVPLREILYLDKIEANLHEGGYKQCWLWTGSTHSNGYPRLWMDGKYHSVHRLIWQWLHIEIPQGYSIITRCQNKLCLSPHHLFAISPGETEVRRCEAVIKKTSGAKHYNTHLTHTQVCTIRHNWKRIKTRASRERLAKHYGIHYNTARAIGEHISWQSSYNK